MTQSIIEESKKAKRKGMLGKLLNKKIIITFLIIVLIAGGYYYYANRGKSNVPAVQVKEWTVKKDDIKIAIESDGKVVAEDGVDLSFSVSGDTLEVTDMYVKEGANVKKGDKIAAVKTDTLQYDLRNAYASYQSALANLQIKQEGPTASDIEKAKISIDQAKSALEQQKISYDKTIADSAQSIANAENTLVTAENNLKMNKDINSSQIIADAYISLVGTIKSINITLDNILKSSDDILGIDNTYANDSFENLLGVKDLSTKSDAEVSYNKAKQEKEALNSLAIVLNNNSSYGDIDKAADQTAVAIDSFSYHLNNMNAMIGATITSTDLTQTELDSFKTSINSNRSSVNSANTSLTNARQSIVDSKSSLDSYQLAYEKAQRDLDAIKKQADRDAVTAKANVTSKEVAVRQAQISYDDLVEPIKDIDLASARSQLTSAAISVDKAKTNLEKTTLISPIDGVVSQLNYKAGDTIYTSDSKAVAIIINKDTLFIEINIEEADINKIKVGDKANSTFEAIDGLKMEGEIGFISLTSSTDNSGIVTYLVKVILNNTKDSAIREGMTAAVEFITSGVTDVLSVPVAAVRNVNNKPSVQLASGEWSPVTTGFTDGEYVEVISGVNIGDKIIY
jgi:RND family efflux transporter MFP subunit